MSLNLTVNSLILTKISHSPLFTGKLRLTTTKSIFKRQISHFFYSTQFAALNVKKTNFDKYLTGVVAIDRVDSEITEGQTCQADQPCVFDGDTFSDIGGEYIITTYSGALTTITYCTFIGCTSNSILLAAGTSLTYAFNCVSDCSLSKGLETDDTSIELNQSAFYNQAAPNDRQASTFISVRSNTITADSLNFSNSMDIVFSYYTLTNDLQNIFNFISFFTADIKQILDYSSGSGQNIAFSVSYHTFYNLNVDGTISNALYNIKAGSVTVSNLYFIQLTNYPINILIGNTQGTVTLTDIYMDSASTGHFHQTSHKHIDVSSFWASYTRTMYQGLDMIQLCHIQAPTASRSPSPSPSRSLSPSPSRSISPSQSPQGVSDPTRSFTPSIDVAIATGISVGTIAGGLVIGIAVAAMIYPCVYSRSYRYLHIEV